MSTISSDGCSTPNISSEGGGTPRSSIATPTGEFYLVPPQMVTKPLMTSKFRSIDPHESCIPSTSPPPLPTCDSSSQPIPIPDSPRSVHYYDEYVKIREEEKYNRSTWAMYQRIVDSKPHWLAKPVYSTGMQHYDSGFQQNQESHVLHERDVIYESTDLTISDELIFDMEI